MKKSETIKSFIRLLLVVVLSINLSPLTSVASADSYSLPDQALADESGKLSPELQTLVSGSDSNAGESVRVIVQTRAALDQVDETVASKGGRVNRSLPLIGGYVAEI